jgi:hypothetical protein
MPAVSRHDVPPHADLPAAGQSCLAIRHPALNHHLRLAPERYRRRHQDHQRLRGKDSGCEIQAGLRAINAADDGAERLIEQTYVVVYALSVRQELSLS